MQRTILIRLPMLPSSLQNSRRTGSSDTILRLHQQSYRETLECKRCILHTTSAWEQRTLQGQSNAPPSYNKHSLLVSLVAVEVMPVLLVTTLIHGAIVEPTVPDLDNLVLLQPLVGCILHEMLHVCFEAIRVGEKL